jgi:hypothetical protein
MDLRYIWLVLLVGTNPKFAPQKWNSYHNWFLDFNCFLFLPKLRLIRMQNGKHLYVPYFFFFVYNSTPNYLLFYLFLKIVLLFSNLLTIKTKPLRQTHTYKKHTTSSWNNFTRKPDLQQHYTAQQLWKTNYIHSHPWITIACNLNSRSS